jgi:hypothetical protein
MLLSLSMRGLSGLDRRGDILLAFCQLRDSVDKPKHDDLGMFKVVCIR